MVSGAPQLEQRRFSHRTGWSRRGVLGTLAAAGGAAQPRVIVIDRTLIMQTSAAGKEMVAQTQALSRAAETQFRNEETALATEANQLQQQMAILAADARAQKEKDFTTKQQAFQNRVAERQAEIQAGFNKAAGQLEVALGPILQAIMRERGANMVLDRSAVILAAIDVDVTTVAVQRLNQALPHVRVELTRAPAGAAAAAAAGRRERPGTPLGDPDMADPRFYDNRGPFTLARRTEEVLEAYAWPGNVRQLKNAVERMAVLAPGNVLTPDLLPPEVHATGAPDRVSEDLPLKDAVLAFKKGHVARALAKAGGNRTRAAQALGLQRTFLSRLLRVWGMQGGPSDATDGPAEDAETASGADGDDEVD